jgi:hypothetical protein
MNRRDFLRTTLAGATVLPSTSPFLSGPVLAADGRRKRLRELGIVIGHLAPGPLNAITDVRGVRVGQTTIVKGQGRGAARTGVTVLLPHEGNIYEERLFASSFGLNGWGEMTGLAAIEETGLLATPIFLTGTYNVGIVQSAASAYLRKANPAMGRTGGTVGIRVPVRRRHPPRGNRRSRLPGGRGSRHPFSSSSPARPGKIRPHSGDDLSGAPGRELQEP